MLAFQWTGVLGLLEHATFAPGAAHVPDVNTFVAFQENIAHAVQCGIIDNADAGALTRVRNASRC